MVSGVNLESLGLGFESRTIPILFDSNSKMIDFKVDSENLAKLLAKALFQLKMTPQIGAPQRPYAIF